MTVEELATLLALPPAAVIGGLIKNGIFATMNQVIDYDTASTVAGDLGFEAAEQTAPTAEDDAEGSPRRLSPTRSWRSSRLGPLSSR